MRRKCGRRHGRRRFRVLVLFCVICLCLLFVWTEQRLPAIKSGLLEASLRAKAEMVIAQTVPPYMEQLSIEASGDLVLPDTYMLSQAKADLVAALQKKLNRKMCVWVPVGNLSGSLLLNGRGLKVPVVFSVKGAVQIDYITEMESIGINRTRYGIELLIAVKLFSLSVSVPEYIETETRYPIYEAVLEGEVPQVITGLR